jgi:hypothetical protein
MMREIRWILLDRIEAATHEIKRLRSLLEENPTLTINESVQLLLFHTKKIHNEINSNPNLDFDLNNIEISPKFQIFII